MGKAWFIFDGNIGEERGLAVVASSLNRAKNYACSEFEDEAVLEGFEVEGASIVDLDAGTIIEGMDGLVRDCYSYCEGMCPLCGKGKALLRLFDGRGEICCADCEERLRKNDGT